MSPITEKFLQAASIQLKRNNSLITMSAIYLPPRFNVTAQQFKVFFKELGDKFIVGGDFNAKNPWWGSRLTNPKGKTLFECIQEKKLNVLSTGRLTYWPADPLKQPDLLDFVVFKGIAQSALNISECDDLSSDHTPLLLNFHTHVHELAKKYRVFRKKTNLDSFRSWIDCNLHLNVQIKTGEELDREVENFTNLIHEAAAASTPESTSNVQYSRNTSTVSIEIRQLLKNKRKLRRIWKLSRNPVDKTILNRATKELKEKIKAEKQLSVNNFLKDINTAKNSDITIWKATKYLKRPIRRNITFKDEQGNWCRNPNTQADAFSEQLHQTFTPFNLADSFHVNQVNKFLDSACQMTFPIKHTTPHEIIDVISALNNNKSPGYDCITANVFKNLPKKGILFLNLLYNSMLRLNYFPNQWKCAEIIMIPKPNKPESCIASYRPISLLSILSKVFEKILLRRLLPLLEKHHIIPSHQFGFRHKHGTPEQCHRIVNTITDALEKKQCCSAVFLDVQQAFDRVWHKGLLYKLKKLLPAPYFHFFKSYLNKRRFYVRVKDNNSKIMKIEAGIPQGSVLGPVLYTIYISDMPIEQNVLVATYADDTAILANSSCPSEASMLIQEQLKSMETWLRKWNIVVNAGKSVHTTFSMRRGECPSVFLHGDMIPQSTTVKYLGMHLDRRLTWKEHIKKKANHLREKTRKMNWLIGRKSELDIENKIKLYKVILRPVWTYGIQLWGTTSHSNVEIIQRYQSKTLRRLVGAPWYVTNKNIHADLGIPYVKDVMRQHNDRYLNRLSSHSNSLAICLLDSTNETVRLKRLHVLDVPFRM